MGGVGGGGGAAQGGEAEALRQHHARGGGGGGVLAGAGVDHQLRGHLTTLLLSSGNMGQLQQTCTQRGYPSILGPRNILAMVRVFFFIEGFPKAHFLRRDILQVDVDSELFYSWLYLNLRT